MFDSASFSGSTGKDNDNDNLTDMEKFGAAVALTGIGHALCDYVLSSEEKFQEFTAMLEVSDEDMAEVREGIRLAHDTFAGLCARAQQDMMTTALFGPDGGAYIDISKILGNNEI
jgi:hypothetical protein